MYTSESHYRTCRLGLPCDRLGEHCDTGFPGFLTHMSSVIATYMTLVPLIATYSALEPVFKSGAFDY